MMPSDRLGLLAAALLLLTMPVFAAVARGRPRDADVAGRPRTVLLGYWVRDWLMWAIAPLERLFLALRIPPVAFNWAGVAFGIAAGVAYALGHFPLGGWLVLLGGAADIFDGRIALPVATKLAIALRCWAGARLGAGARRREVA